MRTCTLVLVLGARAARGDEPEVDIRVIDEGAHEEGPYLSLDPVLTTQLEGLGATRSGERTELSVGQTRVSLEGEWWENIDDDPRRPLVDVEARGWNARMRLSRELGPIRVDVTGSVGRIDSEYGRGTYGDVGLFAGKVWKRGAGRAVWIGIGVGYRRWYGEAPGGEADGVQLMLRVGTTF